MKTLELVKKTQYYAEVNVNVISILPISSENCIRRARVFEILEKNYIDFSSRKEDAQIHLSIPIQDWNKYEAEKAAYEKENFDLLNEPTAAQDSIFWVIERELNLI